MRLAALTLVALSGCATLECSAHGGPGVRSIRSSHFVVTSGLPLQRHQAEVQRLELLWDTFAEFFAAGDVDRSEIEVVVLGDASEVESFSPGVAGFVRRLNARALVVTNIEGSQTSAHELTHLVSAFMLHRQPRWLAEGLATLFEDADFTDPRTVLMGRWNVRRARDAYGRVLSLAELRQWKGDPHELYGSAWAWVHYLINHDEPRLRRLFAALRSRQTEEQLMAEVFPLDDASRLQTEISRYVRNGTFRGWQTSLRRTPRLEPPVELAPWEVHLLRATVHQAIERSREELQLARDLAPQPVPGRVVVAQRVALREDTTELVQQFPDEPAVSVAVWGEYSADADAKLLQQQVAAHPEDPSLLLLAANVELAEGRLERANELAQRGARLAPWSLPFASLQMRIGLDARDCDAALEHYERMLSLVPERERPEALERLRAFERVVRACKPKRP